MANTIKIKRGVEGNLPTLVAGEPGFTTDTKKLFIGDGTTNHFIGSPSVLLKDGSVSITANWNIDGANTLFIDRTNKRIGIGRTNPGGKLEISVDAVAEVDKPALYLYNSRLDTWSSQDNFNSYRYISTAGGASDGSPKTFQVGAGGVAIGYSDTPAYNSGDALYISGNVGIGLTSPGALLHLAAATATKASFRINAGTLLTSPISGTIEYDGTNLYFTDSGGVRRQLAVV